MYRLVGVLGSPDAGKTAILVSLYLLLCRGKLQDFKFADSVTLRAFDEISRGARRWNGGQPPEQMTNHTEDPDERTAGFLHLRLRDRKSGARHDILLPDLPGEWSTSLIDSNRVDRLNFLKAADVIWITVDGRQLIQSQTRQQVLHRTGLLLQRVSEFLNPKVPPVFVVISHNDEGNPSDASLQKLQAEATRLNLAIKILQVASFSDNDAVAPGMGIAELIDASLASSSSTASGTLWPDSIGIDGTRQFLNFRAREALS
jgi:Double-GTPase 2